MSAYRDSNPFPAVFIVLGFAILTVGMWWIYKPAALIAAGLVLTAFGFLGRRGSL